MDCTYKSNRYCLSLLEIVDVTFTNMKFSILFVYMKTKRKENYTQVMKKLRNLMSSDILSYIKNILIPKKLFERRNENIASEVYKVLFIVYFEFPQ